MMIRYVYETQPLNNSCYHSKTNGYNNTAWPAISFEEKLNNLAIYLILSFQEYTGHEMFVTLKVPHLSIEPNHNVFHSESTL